MSLREAVARVEAIGIRFADRPSLEKLKLTRQVSDLATQFSFGGSIPPSEDIQALGERLIQCAESGDFDSISKKDWKKAAWCLWNKENPLASNSIFLTAYIEKMRSWHRRSSYGALIKAYLRDFEIEDQTFPIVAKEIRSVVEEFDWPWAKQHRLFKLFDDKDASRKIAEACLTQAPSVDDALSEMGLTGELAFGGMARAGYAFALNSFERFTNDKPALGFVMDRLMEWSVDDDELRFSGTKTQLAEALLLPWRSPPPEGTKEKIKDFLLHYLKDPRIHKADWTGVSDEARSVMLRWLTKDSLEQFLEVVDRVAMPNHWKYRRAFWTAYFDAGYISEAWVAFGYAGARVARHSFEKSSGFGRLESGHKPVENNHAALIMKVGELTIADWSHMGKCEIWLPDNPDAPRLYKPRYLSDEIMRHSDNGGITHSSPSTGSWQRKVSDYIRNHTGISVPNYMPKRS